MRAVLPKTGGVVKGSPLKMFNPFTLKKILLCVCWKPIDCLIEATHSFTISLHILSKYQGGDDGCNHR